MLKMTTIPTAIANFTVEGECRASNSQDLEVGAMFMNPLLKGPGLHVEVSLDDDRDSLI